MEMLGSMSLLIRHHHKGSFMDGRGLGFAGAWFMVKGNDFPILGERRYAEALYPTSLA
jgi:hypothetical protein